MMTLPCGAAIASPSRAREPLKRTQNFPSRGLRPPHRPQSLPCGAGKFSALSQLRAIESRRMNLLAIDTATEMLSLAVCIGDVVNERSLHAGQRHAELVLGEIDLLLAGAGIDVTHLHGIAYGAGPGSFTGLRIACGIVQGLAAARGVPVVGVGTLAAIAETAGDARVIACLDARMGEVYHAAFERRDGILHEVISPGLNRPSDLPLPDGDRWIGCGAGFAAYGDLLRVHYGGRIARVRPDVFPSAGAILRLAVARFAAGEGQDAASAAPIYLRDRVALKTSER